MALTHFQNKFGEENILEEETFQRMVPELKWPRLHFSKILFAFLSQEFLLAISIARRVKQAV